MPRAIYLLRHAETTHPTVFHGCESDVELSEQGHEQARKIAAHLAAFAPQAIVSSAMRRAIQTARPIADACGLDLEIVPKLHERCVGGLSGKPYGHEGIWAETQAQWVRGVTSFAPPGAESWDDLKHRLLSEWQKLTAASRPERQVVVTHGICCKVLLLEALPDRGIGRWYELGPIFNAAVHEFREADGVWSLVRWNSLPEGMTAPQWASDHGPGK